MKKKTKETTPRVIESLSRKDEFMLSLQSTFARCMEIAEKKNSDYAGDISDPLKNFKLVRNLNICPVRTGLMVRLCDKFSRIANLLSGRDAKVSDESIEDTLRDLINYSAILLYVIESEKNG